MFGNNVFTRVKRSENKKMAEIAHFLKENDLSVDTTVEVFITVSVMTVLLPAAVLPEISLNAWPLANQYAAKA